MRMVVVMWIRKEKTLFVLIICDLVIFMELLVLVLIMKMFDLFLWVLCWKLCLSDVSICLVVPCFLKVVRMIDCCLGVGVMFFFDIVYVVFFGGVLFFM